MADTKITSLLTPQVTTNPATDVLPIVNIADTSMASSGSTRKITVNTLLGAGGTATLASATITGDLTVRTDKLAVRSTGVGIGTTTPNASYILDLTTAYDARARQWVADSSFIGSGNLANGFTIRTLSGTTDGIRFLNYAQSTEFMRIDSTGLGVGRGPLTSLDVFGANKTNTNEQGTLTVSSSDAFAIDKGGSIAFFGKYNTASGNACFARVYGAKENATDGSFTGYFAVSTSPGGTPVERLRIDSTGNVGIGVTPSYKLDTQVAGGADRSILRAAVTGVSGGFNVNWNHATLKTRVIIENIPTSSAGLPSGTLWSDSGTIKIA